jgi:glycosyltransferase involved in cell wall biosynthesis
MARLGINPARGKTTIYQPARVTVAVLTYIPHLDGYFRDRFQVLQLSLASLLNNTSQPFDLMVFDNGSCQQVTGYLQKLHQAGKIDFLILSDTNIGKIGAFSILFRSAPGELVAYADDDIFYYPGWLPALIEIMDAFPDVGMVSGVPVRDAASRSRKSLLRWIESGDARLSQVDYELDERWERDWAESVGRDPEEHLKTLIDQREILLNYDGVNAYGSASHFQFLAPREVLIRSLPEEWGGKLMGEMNELDESIDNLGFLRLSTVDRFTRHIGNTMSPDLVREASSLGMILGDQRYRAASRKHWLLGIPGSGRILRKVYNFLFDVLHNID